MKNPRITNQEIEIIKKAQAGDISAFNKLFDHYKNFVDNLLFKYIKDIDESKDIIPQIEDFFKHFQTDDLDDNKIIVMAEDSIYTLKKGSVRSVRIKPEISTDRTIRTVRILNNLKTDFSDVNIGTKITTSSAVADRISTFVNEYIYRERAKTEEKENEVNQFIENLYDVLPELKANDMEDK